MSTGINAEEDTPVYRDEIFQWPIARMVNYDVWKMIFDKYLTNPLDKKNLLLASPQFFGPWLEEEKCSIFLGEVLHIMHKNNYLKLTNGDFLKYRAISKPCKTSIDTCLQVDNPCFQNLDGIDHDHGRNEYDNPRLCSCWTYSLLRKKYKVQEKIKEYATMIKNGTIVPPAHPFLHGTLIFYKPQSPNEIQSFEHDIRIISSTCGPQIHHFVYHLHGFSSYSLCIVELLCQFLEMMPNLRTLTLENDCPTNCHWDRDRRGRDASYSPFDSFPNLDHLEVLKAKNSPNKILKPLISKYGPQLKKISVYQTENKFKYDGIFSPAINLTELSLPRISTECRIGQYVRDNIKQTSTLKCVSVTIGIPYVQAHGNGIFEELTYGLRKVFQSAKLHTLNLFVDGYYKNDNFYANDIRLKIPTLRRLWIHCLSIQISSIDFILGVSDSLEELVLIMGYNLPADKGQSDIIQFAGFCEKMEESNVWKLMPKLQKITIRYKVYRSAPGVEESISIRPSNISKVHGINLFCQK